MDASPKPNYDYITRAYPSEALIPGAAMHYAAKGDHEFLMRHGWAEVFREPNPGGVMILYRRANAEPHPRIRNP